MNEEMERLDAIKMLWSDGSFVTRTMYDDDKEWLISEVGRLRGILSSQWFLIATAPRDGTRIWAYVPSVHYKRKKQTRKTVARTIAVKWVNKPGEGSGHQLSDHAKELIIKHGGFWAADKNGRNPVANNPTHWMPLPAPPQEDDGR